MIYCPVCGCLLFSRFKGAVVAFGCNRCYHSYTGYVDGCVSMDIEGVTKGERYFYGFDVK